MVCSAFAFVDSAPRPTSPRRVLSQDLEQVQSRSLWLHLWSPHCALLADLASRGGRGEDGQ
jgi:hypothetical protein